MSAVKSSSTPLVVMFLVVGLIGGGGVSYFYFQPQIDEYSSESISLTQQINITNDEVISLTQQLDLSKGIAQNLVAQIEELKNEIEELRRPKSRIEITEKYSFYSVGGPIDFLGNLIECQYVTYYMEAILVNAGQEDGFADISFLVDGTEFLNNRYFVKAGESKGISENYFASDCDDRILKMVKMSES